MSPTTRRSSPASAGRVSATPLAASVALHATVVALGAVLAVGGSDAPRGPVLTARLAAPMPRIEAAPEPAAEDIVVARADAEDPFTPEPPELFDDPPPGPDPATPPAQPSGPLDALAADARLPGATRGRGKTVATSAPPAPPPLRTAPGSPVVPPAARPPADLPRAPGPAPFSAAVPSADNRSPAYPRVAERRGWTGSVVVGIEVDATGAVTAVDVLESSGHRVLDEAAVEAVRTWRYEPARRGGLAVATRIRQPVRFSR